MKERFIKINLDRVTTYFDKHGDTESLELSFAVCENFSVTNAAKHKFRTCKATIEQGFVKLTPSERLEPGRTKCDISEFTDDEMRTLKKLAQMYGAGYFRETGAEGNFFIKMKM